MTDAVPTPPPAAPREAGAGFRLGIDFGPLLTFFLVNWASGIFAATAAFMLATAVAMLVSRWKLGRISPMLWFSGGLVLVFGGLTLWLHSETFIKLKPTMVYSMFAAVLFFGLWTGRPTLKLVLATAYPGIDELGWRKLTRNWAWFFVGMAVLNELVWRNVSTDSWVAFKVWGVMPLSILFALAQTPILMRHGLKSEEDTPLPPQG